MASDPSLEAVGITGEEKEKRKLIHYPKDFFFSFLIVWSAKSSDALQMGQDLISPAYTQVSARSCFSNFLE